MLLQRQPNQKAADLADKLGVSVRTPAPLPGNAG